jgi:hypothetical protein
MESYTKYKAVSMSGFTEMMEYFTAVYFVISVSSGDLAVETCTFY